MSQCDRLCKSTLAIRESFGRAADSGRWTEEIPERISSRLTSLAAGTRQCRPARGLCKSARATCTHVPWRVCQHEACARMFSGVHVSTRLVHACSAACKPAQDSCAHVLRRASQHKTRARMFCGVQASTRQMHACRAVCWRARLRSPHAGSSSDTQTSVCGKGTR